MPLNDELFDRMKHVHINAFGHYMAEILQEIRQDEQVIEREKEREIEKREREERERRGRDRERKELLID